MRRAVPTSHLEGPIQRMKTHPPLLPFFASLLVCLAAAQLPAQDWVHTGTNLGNDRIRIAAADFEPPVTQKFELNVLHAMVIENAAHVGQRDASQRVLEVGMPDSEAGKARARGGCHALLESAGTVFMVGVRHCTGRHGPV